MTRRGMGAAALRLTMSVCLLAATEGRTLAGPAPTVNVQLFRPSSHASDLLSTRTAAMPEHLTWSVGLVAGYSRGALVFEDLVHAPSRRHEVVREQLTLDIMGSVALFDWVDVGLAFPLFLMNEGDAGYTDLGPVSGFVQGDLRLSPKVRILHRAPGADGLGLALDALLVLPTGDASAFVSDGFSAQPTLAVDYRIMGITVALNLGYRIRAEPPQTLHYDGVEVGHEFHWAAAASYDILADELTVLGELQGSSTDFSDGVTNVEGLLAGRYRLKDLGLAFLLGGGGGFTSGYGSVAFRVFGGVTYEASGTGDRDGDGVLDEEDRCPGDAEDADGFEDSDGCPDEDNDGDGLLDAVDKCPDGAEDQDGHADDDGCPDPDNDGDGVLDVNDKCADQQEDLDGYEDDDGCEDRDNDNDGLLDHEDKCPNHAENLNDYQDEDGCPDERLARVERGRIIILDKIYFSTGTATIKARSFPVLRAVRNLLGSYADITKLEVGGHTDDRGSSSSNRRLSQRRADSVRDWLVSQGVAGSRLVAVGYGEDKPAIDEKTARARTANRRVEFNILEGPE